MVEDVIFTLRIEIHLWVTAFVFVLAPRRPPCHYSAGVRWLISLIRAGAMYPDIPRILEGFILRTGPEASRLLDFGWSCRWEAELFRLGVRIRAIEFPEHYRSSAVLRLLLFPKRYGTFAAVFPENSIAMVDRYSNRLLQIPYFWAPSFLRIFTEEGRRGRSANWAIELGRYARAITNAAPLQA